MIIFSLDFLFDSLFSAEYLVLLALDLFSVTLFCGNLYRYVGVFNEAKTTFLVVFGNDENRQNPLWPFRTFD